MENSMYNIQDIDNFFKILPVNDDQICSIICDDWNNLQCLKLALEIYRHRVILKNDNSKNLDFSTKVLLKMASIENHEFLCDILEIASKIQTDKHFYDAVKYLKTLNFEDNQKLLIYMRLLNVFIKDNRAYEILDDAFIISLFNIVIAQNLSQEKNYFITDILKPYISRNIIARDAILNEIFISLDLYTISCIIFEIPLEKFNDLFWLHIQKVIANNHCVDEYKLALNVLKFFVKQVSMERFNSISKCIKGNTETVAEFQSEWQNFFILIEVTEEKQLHLVQPSLSLLKNIMKLNFVWVLCIYKKLLNHMQLSVVYSTAIGILDNEYVNINHYRKCLQCLLSGINRNDCSEYALQFYQKLSIHVDNIDVDCYDILLEESSKINWTPLAAWLFYENCVNMLSKMELDSIKCQCIQQILDNLQKLPHKYIRCGCFDLFYDNIINHGVSPAVVKLKMLEMFKSYDGKYAEAYYAKHIEKYVSINDVTGVHSDFKDHGNNFGTIAKSLRDSHQCAIVSVDNLDVFIHKIFTEKMSSDTCLSYITLLCSSTSEQSNPTISDKIENIINHIFATQHEDVFRIIYENLTTLLKTFSTESLERVLYTCYKQLKTFRNADIRKNCALLYFKTFFTYCDDSFNIQNHAVWSTVFEEVIEDEVTALAWLNNLPERLQLQFSPYIRKMIYFGDCYTKQKRYEDYVCHRIFIAGGVLTGELEPYTTMRLETLKVCKSLGKNCLNVCESLPCIPHKRYFPDSSDHIRHLRYAQTMLVLMNEAHSEIHTFYFEHMYFNRMLWHLCESNHQPSVRQLMQWTIIRLCLMYDKYPDTVIDFFQNVKSMSALTSLILILYHVSLYKSDDFVEMVIENMLEYTMGAIFKLRVYSQIAIFKLISKRKLLDTKYKLLYELLKKTVEKHKESINKALQTDLEFFENFDPEKHYHLRTIFVDIPRMNNVVSGEWQYIEFNLEKFPDYDNILPMDSNKKRMIYSERNQNDPDIFQNNELTTTNIQKKIIPMNICDVEDTTKSSMDLIIVASLVKSSANLGGLARTCEVYGVKQLTVHDKNVINGKEFKSLSMSSESWLNIEEVKIDNMIEYITQIKSNGYIVLGAEQTCQSVKLNEYKFPDKCLLLLGNEKEGIPSHLLPYLDVCIEIPQFGVVRSLNVHVAGSTFIWEYVRQRI